jgi:hypothetical protein
MTFSLIVEIALSLLLAATLVYCAILDRRLAMLRKGQDGLKQTFVELNSAIISAGASMRALKESSTAAAETLDDRLSRARAMADELSVLTASGERIAERMVSQRSQTSETSRTVRPAVLANRLDALRPDALRPEALRPEALRNVR